MGAIDLIGCVTNVTEYSSATTMPKRMIVTATTTKAQMRTSISAIASSADWGWLWSGSCLLNLFLQDWGNKVLRARLGELALGLLASFSVEVLWVLAVIAILLLAANYQQQRQYGKIFHFRMYIM